jgi:hypothetical protein
MPTSENMSDRTTDPHGNATATPTSGQPESESIARRAYERFEMRGGEHGHDQEDWLEAEREIRNERG